MPPSRRLQQVNRHIQRTFGEILQKEADLPPDVLVTITRVDTTANLKSTEVWLSVYPLDQAEAILDRLKPQMYDLQGFFNRALDARPLPRLRLRIDYGAQNAENVERALRHLKEGDAAGSPDSVPIDGSGDS